MLRVSVGFLLLANLCACGGGDGDGDGGAGGTAPAANNAPTLAGTPLTQTWVDESYTFQPHATDADGDVLTFEAVNCPPWAIVDAATGQLHGVPTSADVGAYSGIRIRVTDGLDDTWLPPFEIAVEPVSHGAVTLTWIPPAQNIDDSTLDDLAGFNIYWGMDPDDLAYSENVDGAGISSYFVDGLSPGTYHFATTARNSFGVESELSNFVVVVVH
jgi:hypothetical protein